MKKIIIILSFFIFTSANAGMSDKDKSKAWDCVGIYMANYFLPSGEKFEYGMKEKSISTVKVLKTYALEIGIPEKDWDAGVNKACLLYTSPSPRDMRRSRMPSSA